MRNGFVKGGYILKQYIRLLILIAILLVYCLAFFDMIAPAEGFPIIIKVLTLAGPVFVLIGLIIRQYKRARNEQE